MERPYRPLTEEPRHRRILREISRFLFYPVLWTALVPLHDLRVEGRRKLRGPAVSVMNHCLHIEWFFLWHAVRPRYIRFTAEEANMKRKGLEWFNWTLGVMGIPDDRPMAIAPAVADCLKRGELVHFFPEGVLKRRSQEPGDFMIGAAWFACRHDVPLIPVAEVLHRRGIGRLVPAWPPRVRIIVGDPLHPADFRKDGEKLRTTAARLTAESERRIRGMIAEASDGSFSD